MCDWQSLALVSAYPSLEISRPHVSDALRLEIARLAGFRCEYCRRPEADSFIKYQIDHIISLKHKGATVLSNLAYACPICNANKGSDIGSILEDEDVFIRLFHPRKHDWFDHFEVVEGIIHPKTDIAEVTIKVLDFNNINRILERLDLIKAGIFP